MSTENTNEKLEAIQAAVRQINEQIEEIKGNLEDPKTKPGAKRKLESLSEDMTIFFSKSFTERAQR